MPRLRPRARPLTLALGLVLGSLAGCDPNVAQAEVCAQYTACVRDLDLARDPMIETNLDRFDPGGACWNSEEGGQLCERACTRGLAWEARRSPNPPASCVAPADGEAG